MDTLLFCVNLVEQTLVCITKTSLLDNVKPGADCFIPSLSSVLVEGKYK